MSGTNIPMGGRIISAAEVYDALTTAPYGEKLVPDDAVGRAVDRRQTLVFLDENHAPQE